MKIEKGTGNMNDVDISWIPKETLDAMSTFYISTRNHTIYNNIQFELIYLILIKATASF